MENQPRTRNDTLEVHSNCSFRPLFERPWDLMGIYFTINSVIAIASIGIISALFFVDQPLHRRSFRIFLM